MKKSFLLASSLLVLLAVNGVAYPQQPSLDVLTGKASSYFGFVKARDFDKAAELFHIPKHYSPKARQADIESVARTLEFLAGKFGDVVAERLNQSPGRFYQVVTGGGDLPYWAKHPSFSQLVYEVEFEKQGKGYVTLGFCNIDGTWDIRQVAYGLPSDSPDAQSRIVSISKELRQLIRSGSGGR